MIILEISQLNFKSAKYTISSLFGFAFGVDIAIGTSKAQKRTAVTSVTDGKSDGPSEGVYSFVRDKGREIQPGMPISKFSVLIKSATNSKMMC